MVGLEKDEMDAKLLEHVSQRQTSNTGPNNDDFKILFCHDGFSLAKPYNSMQSTIEKEMGWKVEDGCT